MFVCFDKVNSSEECSICFNTMTDLDVVAHHGPNGQLHPWHRECIKSWILHNPTCPSCRVPLQASALFTWKDRVIIELNHLKTDAYHGAVRGATGATVLKAVEVAGVLLVVLEGGAGILRALAAGVALVAAVAVTGGIVEREQALAGLAGGVVGLGVARAMAGAGVAGVGVAIAGGAVSGAAAGVITGLMARRKERS